jgi:hypothetical protein
MKKFLAGFVLCSVVVLGIIGALAVIPHVHGNDTDHSQHETCPVHQFNLIHTGATVAAVFVLTFIFLAACLEIVKKSFIYISVRSFALLRAPPAGI